MRRRFPPCLSACLAALGCNVPVAPELTSIQDRVFSPSCTFSSCHSADGHAGELVLEQGRSFASLVNQPAAQDQAASERLLRVEQGHPDRSFLVMKLLPGLPAKYGIHMPNGQGQIDADALAAIQEWIRRGANND